METSREHLRWLTGAAIRQIEFHSPVTWTFTPNIGGSIKAFASWRVFASGQVVLSSNELHFSSEHLPQGGSAIYELPALSGKVVAKAEVPDASHDLSIYFESGERLELLSLYSESESWSVTSPEGFHVFGYPRVEVATWNG